MSRTVTEHFPGLLQQDAATALFEHLRHNTREEGVRSREGHTRLAKAVDLGKDVILMNIVQEVLAAMDKVSKNKMDALAVYGCYLNYYRDGADWTPQHSHKGTTQIIISLGGPRTLTVGTKELVMDNGDVAIFGGSVHGVPRVDKADPRISIALFCKAFKLT